MTSKARDGGSPWFVYDGRLAGIMSRPDLLGVYDRPESEIRDEIMTQVIGEEFRLGNRAFIVTVDVGVVTPRGQVECEAVGVSLRDAAFGRNSATRR